MSWCRPFSVIDLTFQFLPPSLSRWHRERKKEGNDLLNDELNSYLRLYGIGHNGEVPLCKRGIAATTSWATLGIVYVLSHFQVLRSGRVFTIATGDSHEQSNIGKNSRGSSVDCHSKIPIQLVSDNDHRILMNSLKLSRKPLVLDINTISPKNQWTCRTSFFSSHTRELFSVEKCM